MGAGHSHTHDDELDDVPVDMRARVTLVVALVLTGLATCVGLVALWPSHAPKVSDPSSAFAAPGVTFPEAAVLDVLPACKNPEEQSAQQAPGVTPTCGNARVRVSTGSAKGKSVYVQLAPEVSRSGLRSGDTLELIQTPARDGAPSTFSFFSVHRNVPLALMALAFVFVVALVARWRGLLALLALGFGAFILVKFMLPALLDGKPGLAVAMTGCAAIMFVVLYLAHGISMRTSAALAGTLLGLGVTAAVGLIGIGQNRLSGISDETGALLSSFSAELDFRGLLTCAVVVAGLGVLNDVTITQASAVWELRAASPDMSRADLFSRAMRIGRDHIASTIYTIVFAYAGAALSLLLLLYVYDRPLLSLISTEEISEEIVKTLASAIGLVLAVPITTAIGVLTVRRGPVVGRRRA